MCVCVCVFACNVSLYDIYDTIIMHKTVVCSIKAIFHVLQQVIPLEWRILTRDCVIYVISVVVLVIVMWDGVIKLYEAIILMTMFVGYLMLLFCSKCIMRWHNKLAHICKTRNTNLTENESKCIIKFWELFAFCAIFIYAFLPISIYFLKMSISISL